MAEPGHAASRPADPGRRNGKSAAAFRTISEVATQLDVPQHVLRFWESKFAQVKPLKRGGGRRYYRPEDIELLRSIRTLLYQDGYTIKGVQKLLREGQIARTPRGRDTSSTEITSEATKPQGDEKVERPLGPDARREIEAVIEELTELRRLLQR